MRYLVDTGVLLRLFDRSDTHHSAIRDSLRHLKLAGHHFVTCPQNIAEFWNVSTRPSSARGGYGHSPEMTERRVSFIERYGEILPESNATYHEWRKLVVAHGVQGASVHDARLVAAMTVHAVSTIITLNAQDFARYTTIDALTPTEVLSSFSPK